MKIGPAHDALKGDRWFQTVNNSDFKITHRWDMGKELAEAGHPDMSSAVRPMAVAPGERFVYFQVSYFHGLVEFDTQAKDTDGKVTYTAGGIPEPRTGAVRRVVNLPNRVPTMPREQYVNDSAHHGLSMDEAGTTMCAAGTMDDYAALVDRKTMKHKIFDTKTTGHSYGKPYWTTEGLNNTCWISLSDSDSVAVLDFSTKKEIAYLPVGDHPQRVRHGYVREDVLAAAGATAGKSSTDGGAGLVGAKPLSRLDSPPAPMVTDGIRLDLVDGQPGPWLPAGVLGLLMVASLAYRMRHARGRRTVRAPVAQRASRKADTAASALGLSIVLGDLIANAEASPCPPRREPISQRSIGSHDRGPVAPPRSHRLGRGCHDRVVRLLPLRHRRRPGLRQALLQRARRPRGAVRRVRDVRGRLPGPPVGGVLFGHFGDRIGRKQMLIADAADHGCRHDDDRGAARRTTRSGSGRRSCWSLLRIVQGIGVGGEYGGAVLLAVEYAPPSAAGFYGSAAHIGVPGGLLWPPARSPSLACCPTTSSSRGAGGPAS